MTPATLERTLEKLGVKPEKAVFVGCDLAQEIAVANTTKMTTVRMKTGPHRAVTPKGAQDKPAFDISKLSELFDILRSSK
jgi:FMN phosphatase YigB (HAD superfamily)